MILTTRTDITYWLPNPSDFFDRYTTISMKPDESNIVKPTIPIEVIDLLLYPRNKPEEREQDGMDRFFQQLLDMKMRMNSLQDNFFHIIRITIIITAHNNSI